MKNLIRFCGVLLLLSLSSCTPSQLSPSDFSGLLEASKNIITGCCLLLNTSDPKLIKLVLPRLYYAYYYIARLINSEKGAPDWENHTIIWNSMTSSIKNKGLQLKSERIDLDYRPHIVSDADVVTQLKALVSSKLFDELMTEFDANLSSYFSTSLFNATISAHEKQLKAEHIKLANLINNLK